MTDAPTGRRRFERAREEREHGDVATAAEYYTASALGHMMEFWSLSSDGELSPTNFGYFARNVLLGALCYRIATQEKRAHRYARIGALIVGDVRDHVSEFSEPEADPPRGLCDELVGDYRTVGQFGDAAEAYTRAERQYAGVANPRQWSVEPEFEIQVITLLELATSVEYGVSEERAGRIRYESLLDRIRFKRDNFGQIVDAVVQADNWESDTI